MPLPQLTLIRHAQGFHNLNIEGHQFHDPRLTLQGQQQCRDLAWKLEDMYTIDCIVASPLLRTLHTALLVFESLLRLKPALRIIALPELQETSDLPCDIGSSVEELEKEFHDKPIDLSLVPHDWTNKATGMFTPQNDRIVARCRKARHFLASLGADNVAVVAHGAVLHYLTDDWYGATSGIGMFARAARRPNMLTWSGTGWYNCEAREYRFDTSTDSSIAEAAIVETDESRLKRTLKAHSFSEEEQCKMKNDAEASWAADGYITLSDDKVRPHAIGKDYKGGKNPLSKPKSQGKFCGPTCCIL